MSTTVTTVISDLLPMLHTDTMGNAIWWTDAEITRWAADFLKRHAELDGVFVLRYVTPLFAGRATYDAPPNHLDTMHVSINGRPLISSSTTELEALNDAFRTAAETAGNLSSRWYPDRIGANKIGVYPVPAAALSDGADLEVIYHGFPCNLDEAHTDTAIAIPAGMTDALLLSVLGEAYATESDATMPEVAANLRQIVSLADPTSLIRQIAQSYWGKAQ